MYKLFVIAAILSLLIAFGVQGAEAEKGVPGSQEFAFGTIVSAGDAATLDQGLALADSLKPDWIYVPVSWSETFPAPDQPNLAALEQVIAAAAQRSIPVVIGLTSAPAWALTPQGPDAALTAELSVFLAQRFAPQVQAIELFPRANTVQAWGAPPNPAAYLNLFRAAQDAMLAKNLNVTLVAAGLQPLPATIATGDMNDLAFLQGLYDAGGRLVVRVISLQYVEITGEPLAAPTENEYRVLRHYEQVRQVMVKNQHLNGLLWITHMNLPTGQVSPSDSVYADAGKQADWLKRAYLQLRSQLYIGNAFLVSLNPAAGAQPPVAMLRPDGTLHPFYTELQKLLYQNKKSGWVEKPGRPKDGNLDKLRQ